MQFFRIRDDESKNGHSYLIIQLPPDDFTALKNRFKTQLPKLACWPIIRNSSPYVVFEYGGAINLSEAFGSGETLGDKLQVGDIVSVILTDKPQDQLFTSSEITLKLNFGLEDVIVYPFTYTKEMEHIYEFYTHYINLKGEDRPLQIKSKPNRLSFR